MASAADPVRVPVSWRRTAWDDSQDEGNGKTMVLWRFFGWFLDQGYSGSGFFALERNPEGGPKTLVGRMERPANLTSFGSQRHSGCVPAEPYPPKEQPKTIPALLYWTIASGHYSGFERTDLSGFVRTTTEKRRLDASYGKYGSVCRAKRRRLELRRLLPERVLALGVKSLLYLQVALLAFGRMVSRSLILLGI